jgi:hypothetical protein
MKFCSGCNQSKPKNQFRYHKDNVDHLTGKCIDCLRLQRRQRENRRQFTIPPFKTCLRCKQRLPSEAFVHNKTCKDGLNGWCRACSKDSALQAKYHISLQEYTELLIRQNGCCAICGTSDPKGPTSQFVVDHCHHTGKIRGLLCNHCNTGLGKLGDTIESLNKAIRYLSSC